MLNPMSPIYSAVIALVAQLCPTLWDTMDCGPPGSSVHGIFQARMLEWVAISFSGWERVVVWSLPDPGIEPISPASQADSLSLSLQASPRLPTSPLSVEILPILPGPT